MGWNISRTFSYKSITGKSIMEPSHSRQVEQAAIAVNRAAGDEMNLDLAYSATRRGSGR